MTQTKLVHRLFISSAIIALALGSTSLQAGKIKCWTNSDGIRECGDIVPAEYAQKDHHELNAQGVRIKFHKRALNEKELTQQKRLDAEKKALQRTIEEQQRQDMILLSTFANEDEIIMTRDGKITTIRTEVRLTYKSMNKTKESLNKLRKLAANNERSGKPVPTRLNKNIQKTQKQLASYEVFISFKKKELDKINTQFESDMIRFKKLRRPTH